MPENYESNPTGESEQNVDHGLNPLAQRAAGFEVKLSPWVSKENLWQTIVSTCLYPEI